MIEPIRKYIAKNLSEGERYAQLAKECNELGKASLKIRRVITQGASPTPVAIKDALDNLHEEIADVLVCCEVLPVDWTIIREIKQKKSDRWTLRLRDRKEVQQE